MTEVLDKAKLMIEAGDLDQAEVILADSYQLDAWREQYGTEILISLAYCRVFKKEEGQKDTANIRASIQNLSEEKILSMPEEFMQMAYDLDNELQRLEQVALPDDKELELRKVLETSDGSLDQMFELADHLISKNRAEEAVDLLLDIVAIDRNW